VESNDPRRGCCMPFALSAVSRSSRRGRNRHRYSLPAQPAVFALFAPARRGWQSTFPNCTPQPRNMLAVFAPRRPLEAARDPRRRIWRHEARNVPSFSDYPLDFPCLHVVEFITRSSRVRLTTASWEISEVPSALSRSKRVVSDV